MESRLPIVILAGSDMQRGFVPPSAENLHFMVGYKGADVRVRGRPLAELVLERVRESDAFGDVYLAGPSRIYSGLVDCPIVDTDGHLGENLAAAIEHVAERHGSESRIAFIACDVLPEAREIAELGSLLAAPRESGVPPALAISLIAADQDLGSSSWKPKYFFRPRAGLDLEPFLPGHLGIAWPSRLRTGLLLRLLHLAYRQRNRGYSSRKRTIVLSILGTLIRRDLWNLARLEPPTLTYSVLRHGLGTFARWRRGEIDLAGLELGLAKIVVRRRHFRREGPASVRIATSRHISFAKDLDTREELAELDRRVSEPLP